MSDPKETESKATEPEAPKAPKAPKASKETESKASLEERVARCERALGIATDGE